MKVWLVTTGEPLPGDGGARLFRTGLLATRLAQQHHDVLWWTSTFDHIRKRQRAAHDTTVDAPPGYRIRLIRSPGYGSNLSLGRIVDHARMAKGFAQQAQTEPTPDVILCSLPTLELSVAATEYGLARSVPVVLDIRDLWPDVQIALMPKVLRPAGRAALLPMAWQARRACRRATAITGVTKSFIGWALRHAGREATERDQPFPMGYPSRAPDDRRVREAEAYWESQGVRADGRECVVCFIGTVGRLFELAPVLAAARRLESEGRRFRFVICGSGEKLAAHRLLATGCNSVLFPGWVDEAKIWTLMRRSTIGIAPYLHTANFLLNIPNKPIEYLSAGLPILTNLSGELGALIEDHDCGMTYESNNVSSLLDALTNMVSSPTRIHQLAGNAMALYTSTFTADHVYGEMGRYLEDIAVNFRRSQTAEQLTHKRPVTA